MPDNYNSDSDKLNKDNFSKTDLEILKNKLQLDKNTVELLLNSKGSIKSKSFFNKVLKLISQS